jgi:hypothetical protein
MNIDRQPGSRLPEDPAYWQHLAARSVDAAFGAAVEHAGSPRDAANEPWWRGMSDAAFMLAASAVFALIGGSLLLDNRLPRTTAEAHPLTGALAPDDDLLASLLNADAPPPAAAMLRLVALREVKR